MTENSPNQLTNFMNKTDRVQRFEVVGNICPVTVVRPTVLVVVISDDEGAFCRFDKY